MRKVLTISISALLTGLGSQAAYSTLITTNENVSHQYTHLTETYQSQTFESLSQAVLFSEQPALNASYKLAAVHFITDNGEVIFLGQTEFKDETIIRCQSLGYTLTSCGSGSPKEVCPYNSSYFKSCCSADYKYDADDCVFPLTKSTDTCGGKYSCYCDTALYPVTGCTSPQIPQSGSGSSCVFGGKTYYAGCACPDSYIETCSGNNLQGKGSGCSQNGETRYMSCECKSGYNLTCTGEGSSPLNPTDYCLLNGIKYYNTCKVCEKRCQVAEEDKLPNIIYEYEECSQKYCDIGCAVGYVDWCVKPEIDCVKLGYVKTVNECLNGYLKCPYNSTAGFCED